MSKHSSMRPDKPAGLVFFEAQEKPRQYVIFDKARIRGRQEVDVFTTSVLQLSYPFLDEEQCEIRFEDGKWIYQNLSENVFTFVNGKNLKCGEERELKDNSIIRMSNDRMLTAVFLQEFASCTDWQMINMDDGRHTVVIENETQGAGKAAFTLEYENSRWQLKNIGVSNLLLNGRPVGEATPLQFDDCLQTGSARFVFEGSGLLYNEHTVHGGLNIAIDERTVINAMKKVTLLKDINLSVDPGSMVMILGGSGAGKSTFVNAVTGYEKAKATITEGGMDYYKQYGQVKYRIGFVPQENLMREEDTVLMTVSNAADLRLPASLTEQEKKRRVRMALETFGLSGREDTLVSKLSGGQKKRLSISTEFVASPNLFILDEPDSGLDGIMARELMENLRLIACQGKMVLVITHAPDRVANLFDKVIVLAKGTENHVGQLAFYGGIQEAKNFLKPIPWKTWSNGSTPPTKAEKAAPTNSSKSTKHTRLSRRRISMRCSGMPTGIRLRKWRKKWARTCDIKAASSRSPFFWASTCGCLSTKETGKCSPCRRSSRIWWSTSSARKCLSTWKARRTPPLPLPAYASGTAYSIPFRWSARRGESSNGSTGPGCTSPLIWPPI